MAITVMATVEKTNKVTTKIFALCTCFILVPTSLAGEWTFTPSVGLTETFSDNVELNRVNQKSSLVSQLIIELNSEFKSKGALFSFSGTETLADYSHNNDLNDDFQFMDFKGLVSLWSNGPQFILNSEIHNISKNESENSLADLVSGDTVQQRSHHAGFQYNITNSHHDLSSSLVYNIVDTEDGIGERRGYKAILDSENGNAARMIFWQINGQFSYQENDLLSGESYSIESKVGAITPFNVNPFVRFYNEDISGSIVETKPNTAPSWGPGIQWLATKHFTVDLSYNYIQEDVTTSDDYIAATIEWQPSQRTRLKAGYSQRFFGDSYNFDFQHKTKRLENAVTYDEAIEVFDRNSFEETSLGQFWCSIPITSSVTPNDCRPSSQPPTDTTGYRLVSFSDYAPVINKEFSLNKRLAWTSTLSLARTTFKFLASARERQTLDTDIVDEYFDAELTITRKTSAKGEISLRARFNKNNFDKNNLEGVKREDTYKTISTSYTRDLGSSLNTIFTLQFLDKESSRKNRNYNEVRATLNITKDF
jgi:uncharacterized protein (PEP-CTERM system associated)